MALPHRGKSTHSERHLQRLERLLHQTHKIHSTLELDRALEIVLDAALELTEMQRGFVMLLNEEGGLDFRQGRDNKGKTLTKEEFQVSQTVVDRAMQQKKLYYFVSPAEVSSDSVMNLQIGSGFCVPLFSYRSVGATEGRRTMVGILYEDSKRVTRFGREEEEIVEALALHAGLALENAGLYELATLDGLTRVYQRRYFDSVADLEWERARRHKRPLSIILADLDHFKSVNDTFGHDRGDQVLRRTAQLLKGACRMEDVVARFGGEEFVILLPETDQAGAALVCLRIYDHFSGKIQLEDRGPLTISLGVASHPQSGATDSGQLVKFADLALYEAKRSGRNRVCYYEPKGT